jgi:hypothetical protein
MLPKKGTLGIYRAKTTNGRICQLITVLQTFSLYSMKQIDLKSFKVFSDPLETLEEDVEKLISSIYSSRASRGCYKHRFSPYTEVLVVRVKAV